MIIKKDMYRCEKKQSTEETNNDEERTKKILQNARRWNIKEGKNAQMKEKEENKDAYLISSNSDEFGFRKCKWLLWRPRNLCRLRCANDMQPRLVLVHTCKNHLKRNKKINFFLECTERLFGRISGGKYLRGRYCRVCCWSAWLCWKSLAALANVTRALDCPGGCTCAACFAARRHQLGSIECPRTWNGNRWPRPSRARRSSVHLYPGQPVQHGATETFVWNCQKPRVYYYKMVNELWAMGYFKITVVQLNYYLKCTFFNWTNKRKVRPQLGRACVLLKWW